MIEICKENALPEHCNVEEGCSQCLDSFKPSDCCKCTEPLQLINGVCRYCPEGEVLVDGKCKSKRTY